MVAFPQHGGCLCGDVRYRLDEDPVTLYVCHCTDCQTQTGTSFALSMVVRRPAFQIVRGEPREAAIELADGRVKRALFCGRCAVRFASPSRLPGLTIVEPGTLDDTSWVRPVGHIWARSAQPFVVIPEDTLRFEAQPSNEGMMALVRAWKGRADLA
jgi:hypothetical protein